MFFSVLIPVYNTSAFLRECIDSVLVQTFSDYEIVLIDDGSTDCSGAICDEYADQYPFIRVIHKQNEGLMMTRRRGFKEANGDYFICVDSDDYLCDSRAFEKIHDLILCSSCDLVLYNYTYGAGGGRNERIRQLFEYENGHVFVEKQKTELYEKLLTTNSMNNIWIKCPARNIVDIDTDYSMWKNDICRAEDLFQSYPMLSNASRIGYVSDPLYFYRWTETSISNKPKYEYCDAFKTIFQREDEYLQKWEVPSEIKDQAIRRRLTRYMDIIVKCYFSAKLINDVSGWKMFICLLSEDQFFKHILDGCNKKKVLKYYRLLYFLLRNKKTIIAIHVIEITSHISNLKRAILKGKTL